jgi:hypothetical protein
LSVVLPAALVASRYVIIPKEPLFAPPPLSFCFSQTPNKRGGAPYVAYGSPSVKAPEPKSLGGRSVLGARGDGL